MEGAVRSGLAAAELALADLGASSARERPVLASSSKGSN